MRHVEPIGDPSDPQGMIAMLEQYLERKEVETFSNRTINTRREYLRAFIDWCAVRGVSQFAEITKPIIERYRRFLFYYRKRNGDSLSFRSQIAKLVMIREWFQWMAHNNRIPYNPASNIELPGMEDRLPNCALTASEAERVITCPNDNQPQGLRDRAILETFHSTRIRQAEMVGVGLRDLDMEAGVLTMRQGKSRKDRRIPIGDRALAWVERYLFEVRPSLVVNDKSGDTLFLNDMGEPFSLYCMTRLVKMYVTAAGIDKRCSCHLLRHPIRG